MYKKCPVCNKKMKVSEEMEVWESEEDVKKVEEELNKLTFYTDQIIEIIHHSPKFNTQAKRLAIFYTILDRLMANIMFTNAEKCGVLELVKSHIFAYVHNSEAKFIIDFEKRNIKKKSRSYVM